MNVPDVPAVHVCVPFVKPPSAVMNVPEVPAVHVCVLSLSNRHLL